MQRAVTSFVLAAPLFAVRVCLPVDVYHFLSFYGGSTHCCSLVLKLSESFLMVLSSRFPLFCTLSQRDMDCSAFLEYGLCQMAPHILSITPQRQVAFLQALASMSRYPRQFACLCVCVYVHVYLAMHTAPL